MSPQLSCWVVRTLDLLVSDVEVLLFCWFSALLLLFALSALPAALSCALICLFYLFVSRRSSAGPSCAVVQVSESPPRLSPSQLHKRFCLLLSATVASCRRDE